MTPAALRAACRAAVQNPTWQPVGGLTFCNMAADSIARLYGANLHDKGRVLMANEIIRQLQSGPPWARVMAYADAQTLANAGHLLIAGVSGQPHGHVTVIAPTPEGHTPMWFSPTWQCSVPWVANVGRRNGIVGMSGAYHSANRPEIFHFTGETPQPKGTV